MPRAAVRTVEGHAHIRHAELERVVGDAVRPRVGQHADLSAPASSRRRTHARPLHRAPGAPCQQGVVQVNEGGGLASTPAGKEGR